MRTGLTILHQIHFNCARNQTRYTLCNSQVKVIVIFHVVLLLLLIHHIQNWISNVQQNLSNARGKKLMWKRGLLWWHFLEYCRETKKFKRFRST